MNIRKIWTELVQKPSGRLVLFLLVLAVFLAFIFSGRKSQPRLDNRTVAEPATKATSYSFEQKIPETTRTQTTQQNPSRGENAAARPAPTPKAPPPIPQAIFATREQSRSEFYLPYGRLLKCELVNTVDSINLDTPIIGLVTEDVWQDGRLIIPAGCEVHGTAQKSGIRDRIGSDRNWMLVFQDGRELPLMGTVLDYAPNGEHADQWGETDGSAGLHGYTAATDKYGEAKAILASMLSAGANAFPQTINSISPLTGGVTQIQQGGYQDAISAGMSAGANIYSQRLLDRLDKDPYFVRVPGGTTFYLYVTQSVDLQKALSASTKPSLRP
ncbi:hypothetical protein BH09VER1_BH09VER1_29430 [soil metagenome]